MGLRSVFLHEIFQKDPTSSLPCVVFLPTRSPGQTASLLQADTESLSLRAWTLLSTPQPPSGEWEQEESHLVGMWAG